MQVVPAQMNSTVNRNSRMASAIRTRCGSGSGVGTGMDYIPAAQKLIQSARLLTPIGLSAAVVGAALPMNCVQLTGTTVHPITGAAAMVSGWLALS